jgi:hypothetical protein
MEDVAGAITFTVDCYGSSTLTVRAKPHTPVFKLVRVLVRVLAARARDTEQPPPSGGRLFFAEHPLFEGQPLDSELGLSDCGIGEGAKLLFMPAQTDGVAHFSSAREPAGEADAPGPEAHGHEQPPGEMDLAEAMERLAVTERAAAPSAATAGAGAPAAGGAGSASGGGGSCAGDGGSSAQLPSQAMD